MEYAYVVPYLQSKIKNPALADALKQEIERRFYHYGAHFTSPFESNTVNLKSQLILEIREILIQLKGRFNSKKIPNNSIVSNAYVSAGKVINSNNFNFIRPPWASSLSGHIFGDYQLLKNCIKIKDKFKSFDLNILISEEFLQLLEELTVELENYYSHPNIVAGLFPYDIGFFECLSINILKKLNKKSIVYIHGIPGVYEQELYTRGDHILVFGHQIKENFKKINFPQEKIHVVGYPQRYTQHTQLKNNFDKILVVGHSMPGSHFTSRSPILYDRGDLIYYPFLIQDILKKFGVKGATFRPHPSEKKDWYRKNIDLNFYSLDLNQRINDSIDSATLVIGPSSSVAIEAIALGVNYICFEPFLKHHKLLAPPFDGTDHNLITCFSQRELDIALEKKSLSKQEIVNSYFDLKFNLDEKLKLILELK